MFSNTKVLFLIYVFIFLFKIKYFHGLEFSESYYFISRSIKSPPLI